MKELNDVRFKHLIDLGLDDKQREQYHYKKDRSDIKIYNCCTSCEQKCKESAADLSQILYGTTTQDYLNYLVDVDDTENWNDMPVMFVFENPGKCPKEDFVAPEPPCTSNKVVATTWPYIGWGNRNKEIDFKIEDNYKNKKYGEMILATILHYKLKNAYVTNLVKCGMKSGQNLNSYDQSIIDNCVDTIFMKNLMLSNPAWSLYFLKQ